MKKETTLILRKGIVVVKVQNFKYLVEDLFDNEIIMMIVSGKTKMFFSELKIGEQVYVIVPPFASTYGRMVTSTHFKQNPDLLEQKKVLDNK